MQKESTGVTTLSIEKKDGKNLDFYCKSIGIKKKDFVPLALAYFAKYGIDLTQDESPTAEMQQIKKRLDQFFAFFRKQEQDYIMPLIGQTEKINGNIAVVFNKLKKTSETVTANARLSNGIAEELKERIPYKFSELKEQNRKNKQEMDCKLDKILEQTERKGLFK